MYRILKGMVVSDVSKVQDGSVSVQIGDDHVVNVAYTSPHYTANGGGIFAPPTVDSPVMILEDTSLEGDTPHYLYLSTIVDDPPTAGSERIPEFKAVRADGGRSAYSKDDRPTKITLQNSEGQGISTTTDLSNSKRVNNTSLDSSQGGYISAGEQGCQMVTEHKDGIVVQGESNPMFPYRSITMRSQGSLHQHSEQHVSTKVGKKGADIRIDNLANTPLTGGGGIAAGNVRISSTNRDITLRTGGPGAIPSPEATRNINLITPGAEIQVNGQTGAITIRSIGVGSLNLESNTELNLNSPIVNVNGVLSMTGGGVTVGPDSFNVNVPEVNINGELNATFQSGAAGRTVIDGQQTTIQGEVMTVHGKGPGGTSTGAVPPQITYANVSPIPGLNYGVGTGPNAPKIPSITLPLPSLGPVGGVDVAAAGIPNASVVTRNSYFDNPIV